MKKIAYFHIFDGPPIEASVGDMLREAFPDYDLEAIALLPLIRSRPRTVLLNTLASIGRLRTPSVRGFKRAFMRTPFLFDSVRRVVRRKLGNQRDRYAFTFQLQSLFDVSVPPLPHFVYTDHTHLANLEYPGFRARDLNSRRWIERERQIYANASHVFTRSSNITRSLVDDYAVPATKISCVGAGTNTPPPAVQARPGSGKRVLFVGSDWDRKGGPTLAAAFCEVRARHPDATLTVVGCRPTLGPGCESVGKIPVREVSHYYEQADIFCLPTTNEPFGVVLIEAMAHGLPVVATDVGAIPDMVAPGHNGELVQVGDVQGLAETLSALLEDPDKLRRYGRSSNAVVATRYNWHSVGQAVRTAIMKHMPTPPVGQQSSARSSVL